jgi:hypothetical protein
MAPEHLPKTARFLPEPRKRGSVPLVSDPAGDDEPNLVHREPEQRRRFARQVGELRPLTYKKPGGSGENSQVSADEISGVRMTIGSFERVPLMSRRLSRFDLRIGVDLSLANSIRIGLRPRSRGHRVCEG